jgi:hypothetical protein
MSFDWILWVAVGVLTLAATWLCLPRPPELDWERFFKTVLVTLIRGPLEAADETAVTWLAASRTRVWYHPGSRDLLAKLQDPAAYEIPVPALTGERALVQDLIKLPDATARVRRTFLTEPLADECLFDDPLSLGDAYDTVPVLGPKADWEAISRWEEPVVEGLRRRQEHARWAVLGDPKLAEVLVRELGEGRAVALQADTPDALEAAAKELVPEPSDRLIWVARGSAAGLVVRTLQASPGLRDRTRAVVALGAHFDSETQAWFSEHFTHASMDTEISRATPYFQVSFVVPGVLPIGEPGQPLDDSHWPVLAPPDNGRVAVERVDLGILPGPAAALSPELLARALLVTVVQRLSLVG